MANDDDQPVSDSEPDEAGDEQPDNDEKAKGSWPPHSIFEGFGKQYNQLFANLRSSMIRNVTAGFTPLNTASWFPQLKTVDPFPQLKTPTLGIDIAALNIGKGLADVVRMHQIATVGPIVNILEQQRTQWDSLFESLRKLAERVFPPNWKGVKRPDLSVIETILVDEGIPLAWVPSSSILQALLDAPDAKERRKIIGRRWRRIVSDCEAVLDEVSHPSLQCHHPFAADIASALRDGHSSAAQALAANLLDSMLRRNFDPTDLKDVTSNKKNGNRFDLDAYQARAAFTLAPIWQSYAQYHEEKGDPIPRAFGRHPSAHAVCRRQYSRTNAVIALMLVTSLLRLLDTELVP